MNRFLFSLFAFLVLTGAASASASFGCSLDDKSVAALDVEGVTSRDGKYLDSIRGELEIEPGKKIEFSKANVKTFGWGQNIAIHLVKGPLELRIYAKPVGDDGIDFEGSYVVRGPKLNKSGKVKCSGG